MDRQRGQLDEKREALEALKAASGEKEAELLSEISRLKQQAQKDKAELEKAQEQAKEVEYAPPSPTSPYPSCQALLFSLKYLKASRFMRPSVASYSPLFLSRRLQERRRWTTAAAWSSKKQTVVSERGLPAWYSTLT